MARVTITNPTGDHEELLERFARDLGRSPQRRAVFCEIYRGQRRIKTAEEIAQRIELSTRRVLQIGKDLAHKNLVIQTTKGSPPRVAYEKDSTVQPLRDKLLKLLQNPKTIDEIPTKRRARTTAKPAAQRRLSARGPKSKVNVLYLTAAGDGDPLRVDAEVRMVQEQLRGAAQGNRINLYVRPAAAAKTLVDGLNDLHPEIVHFSGHGSPTLIAFDAGNVENRAEQHLPYDVVHSILSATDHRPKLIVLNACNSDTVGPKFLECADHVIAMSASVSDLAASAFAAALYAALGAGQSLASAFGQGKNAISILGSPDSDIPTLHSSPKANARITKFL